MTVLTFPTIRGASTAQWGLIGYTQAQISPFDGTAQTIAMPGARWKGSLAFNNLALADWRTLAAFLASLGGRSGRFTMTPPQAWRRATAAVPGPVQINGAGQSGAVLAIKGLPASTIVLEAGDFLSWPSAGARPQLHMATAQVISNGSGLAWVPIAPPIRLPGNDSAAVTIDRPVGVFMLSDDEQGASVHDGVRPTRASISFDVIEALA